MNEKSVKTIGIEQINSCLVYFYEYTGYPMSFGAHIFIPVAPGEFVELAHEFNGTVYDIVEPSNGATGDTLEEVKTHVNELTADIEKYI